MLINEIFLLKETPTTVGEALLSIAEILLAPKETYLSDVFFEGGDEFVFDIIYDSSSDKVATKKIQIANFIKPNSVYRDKVSSGQYQYHVFLSADISNAEATKFVKSIKTKYKDYLVD